MARRVAASVVLAVALASLAAPARAQSSAPPPTVGAAIAPPVTIVFPAGEPTFAAGALAPSTAALPTQLSLMNDAFPVDRLFPGCATREEASGNAVSGFAVQRRAGIAWTPRLSLVGFSSAGCPVDGAVGGVASYALPLIPHDLWLVASAGMLAQPGRPGAPRVAPTARLDLMMQGTAGRSYGVGVDVRRRGLAFTGTW